MEHVQVLTTVISGLPQHCKRLKGRCGDALSRLIRVSSRSTSQKPYSVSQKNPPYGFLKFSPKRLGIFNQFFTHLLCDDFYTRLQIFIQLSPTLTKLCHTKRDHLANFYISLEL